VIRLRPAGPASAVALAAVGTVCMLVSFVAREGLDGVDLTAALYVLVGASFTVSGAIAWARRPDSHIGGLMTGFAILWAAAFLMRQSESPLIYTLAGFVQNLWYFVYAVILLSFPTGRLTSPRVRLLAGSVLVAALPMELARLLFLETSGVPRNVLLVWPSADTAEAISTAQRILFVGWVVAVLAVLTRRWFVAAEARRRALAPAVAGAPLLIVAAIVVAQGTESVPEALLEPLLIAFTLAPIALLASMLRARLARSAVADLLIELHRNPARQPCATRSRARWATPRSRSPTGCPSTASTPTSTGRRSRSRRATVARRRRSTTTARTWRPCCTIRRLPTGASCSTP
jgi:hypothetical protein